MVGPKVSATRTDNQFSKQFGKQLSQQFKQPGPAKEGRPMVAADLRNEAERSLDQLFEWCCAGARARPPGRPGLFRFDVETPTGTRTRYVTSTDEGTAVVPAAPCPPNSTVTVSQEDLTRLVLGDLRGSLAFATGVLRIEGDVFLAMTWIDQLRRGPL
jgi:hypothetical protein